MLFVIEYFVWVLQMIVGTAT